MTKAFLYIVEGDEESEKAVRILSRCRVNFQKVVVSIKGNGKSMWRDIETTEVPTLHSPKGTFVGIKEIEKFCRK